MSSYSVFLKSSFSLLLLYLYILVSASLCVFGTFTNIVHMINLVYIAEIMQLFIYWYFYGHMCVLSLSYSYLSKQNCETKTKIDRDLITEKFSVCPFASCYCVVRGYWLQAFCVNITGDHHHVRLGLVQKKRQHANPFSGVNSEWCPLLVNGHPLSELVQSTH